jgi:hypothetical protein
VCYLNKYTIKSINSKDSIHARNLSLVHFVDWSGETHNSREF